MGQKIKQIMSNDKTQRILYFIGILLWTFLWYIDDLSQYPNKTLDIGWAIPAAFLLFQIIFNNKIMWLILFSIFVIFATAITLGMTYSFITSTKVNHGNVIYYIICISVVSILTLAFYHMRPKRIDKLKHSVE